MFTPVTVTLETTTPVRAKKVNPFLDAVRTLPVMAEGATEASALEVFIPGATVEKGSVNGSKTMLYVDDTLREYNNQLNATGKEIGVSIFRSITETADGVSLKFWARKKITRSRNVKFVDVAEEGVDVTPEAVVGEAVGEASAALEASFVSEAGAKKARRVPRQK